MSSPSPLHTPPPPTTSTILSFPHAHILLVTLNRPQVLNCINSAGHRELHEIWNWFDAEPSLRVAILTGRGRAFCAGADLKEWNTNPKVTITIPPTGFGGISRRSGTKPIICAINGPCLGGGTEIIINSDLNISSSRAFFSLPEVQRGVVALAGGLPRLVRTLGRQRAMEMALTGRKVSAAEAERWGLINEVVSVGEGDSEEVVSEKVVKRAVEVAVVIARNSPDAVVVSREGVKMGWEVGAEEGSRLLVEKWEKRLLVEGENGKEGVRAFVEKREPRWVDSKL